MRIILLFLIALFSAEVVAENAAPNWKNAHIRETTYPAEKYYTGFASDKVEEGADISAVYERVQQMARIAVISSIQVSVEHTAERYMQNTQMQGYASTKDIMTSYAKSHTSIKDVPGLKVETWENHRTGEISAFAWVKISDLSTRLLRRIATNIGKLEEELHSVEFLSKRNEKVQAKNNLPSIRSMLEDIENDQRIMLSIDPSITDEDLFINEIMTLKERFCALDVELKTSIAIYVECKTDLFGKNHTSLNSEICGALSKIGCEFVTRPDQADWVVYVTAMAREYRTTKFGRIITYFAYVDATVIIDKVNSSQRVFEDQVSELEGHTHNYEQAAREAYKEISAKISSIIVEQISR